MADDQYDALAKVLAELPGRFGANVFSDRRRVVSVLSDRVPEARREIRVIGSCIDDGIFDALSSTRPDQVVFEIDRLAARIEGNLGVRKDIALPVVRACAHGLGRGPLPSAYGPSLSGAMPPAPGDAGDSWVGVSEPVPPSQRPPGTIQPGTSGSWVNPSSYPPPGTPSQANYGQPPQGYAPGPTSQGNYAQTAPGYTPPGSQVPGTYVPTGSGGATAASTSRRNAIILAVIGGIVLLLGALFVIGMLFGEPTPQPKPDPQPKPRVVDPQPKPQPDPQPKPRVVDPQPQPDPQPKPGTVTEPEPADLPNKAQPKPQPQPQPQPQPKPQPGGRIFGDETRDFGVAPQSVLQTKVGSPTPNAIPVGKIISTVLLEEEIRKGTQFLLVDVLEGQHAQTIVKARYIAYGGRGGSFNDQVQSALANELNQLTNGRKDFPIVFFCQGVQCWESYNAVLRAWNAGYRNVYWYRGGLVAWQQAGFPMMATPASR